MSLKFGREEPTILSAVFNLLQVFFVDSSAAGVPYSAAVSEDTLYCAAVEADEQFLKKPVASQHPQEEQSLLVSLDDAGGGHFLLSFYFSLC